MRLTKNKSYNQFIIHLFFIILVSCNSQSNTKIDQLSQTERDAACKENAIIVTPRKKISRLVDDVIAEEDFYVEGRNEYYAFDIYLDSLLVVQDIDMILANNKEVAVKISKILEELDYKILKQSSECNFYAVRFTIKARTKKLLYPDSENYYNMPLPVE